MTYGEVLQRIIYEVYGDTPPEQSVYDYLRGSEGKIADVRRQIQEDDDFWFMEATDTIALVNATAQYDLDEYFKKEIVLWVTDENGIKYPIGKVLPGQLDLLQNQTSENPIYYYIDWNPTTNLERINLYPTPAITVPATRTLNMRYFQFLEALPNDILLFDAEEDIFSIECPYLLIYAVASHLLENLKEYDKMQTAAQLADDNLTRLKGKHERRRSANYTKVPYKGL